MSVSCSCPPATLLSTQGVQFCDRGGGVPEVVIADIRATAGLLAAAHACQADRFYHWRRLVLYLDEPNMGLHLDPQVRMYVRLCVQYWYVLQGVVAVEGAHHASLCCQ